jgi:hypothetical protein
MFCWKFVKKIFLKEKNYGEMTEISCMREFWHLAVEKGWMEKCWFTNPLSSYSPSKKEGFSTGEVHINPFSPNGSIWMKPPKMDYSPINWSMNYTYKHSSETNLSSVINQIDKKTRIIFKVNTKS